MQPAVPDPQIIVIFGASGDLTHRKIIPALYNLFREKMLPEHFAIVGYARTEWTDEQFREEARKSLEEFSRTSVEDEYWKLFSDGLTYRYGAFDDEKVFRFANTLYERVWNRDAIAHVQITVAEEVGVEQRGGYYEEAGVIRDMVQNHILQLVSFLGMEPPASLAPEAVRDEKVKLLRAV